MTPKSVKRPYVTSAGRAPRATGNTGTHEPFRTPESCVESHTPSRGVVRKPHGRRPGNPVADWCMLMLDAIRTTRPIRRSAAGTSRSSARRHMTPSTHRPHHQPYRVQVTVSPNAHIDAAAIAAGHEVMLSLYPGFRARTEELFASQRSALRTNDAVNQGLDAGREAAKRLLSERGSDGSNTEIPYIPSDASDSGAGPRRFFRPR